MCGPFSFPVYDSRDTWQMGQGASGRIASGLMDDGEHPL